MGDNPFSYIFPLFLLLLFALFAGNFMRQDAACDNKCGAKRIFYYGYFLFILQLWANVI